MPHIKAISGHTRLGACQAYLEKEGRALARDFLNLPAPMEGLDENGLPQYGRCDWSSAMDATRAAFGNDRPWHGKAARTYKHYVISPDPDDGIDLPKLREIATRWTSKHFPDYEVAIVYHDDNEHRIPHAHVIVNNTNLDTGHRLQDPDPGALNGSLQAIARDMGLTHFTGRIDGAGRDETHARRKAVDRPEKELQSRGEYSWVADIRARIDVARGISDSPDAFRQTLRSMGISVRESASRKGDWVYALADAPSRQVTGSRLGATYTRSHIARELSSGAASPLLRGGAEIRSAARSAIEVGDLRELTHLAEAVRTVSQGGFKSLSGIDAAIARVRQDGKHPATLERLMRVRTFCEERSMLPKYPARERPVSYGDYQKRLQTHGNEMPGRASRHERDQARPSPSPERGQGRDR